MELIVDERNSRLIQPWTKILESIFQCFLISVSDKLYNTLYSLDFSGLIELDLMSHRMIAPKICLSYS